MKHRWVEDDAVSPVIATILMVAITVVLAAVLYVMVIGMSGNNQGMTATPVGSWQDMDVLSSESANLVFGNFQPETRAYDIKLLIEDENGFLFNLTFPTSTISSDNYTMACDAAASGITAYYYDYNPTGGMIGAGDHIQIYGLDTYTIYSIRVFHYPTESVVQMAGDTDFQTLP